MLVLIARLLLALVVFLAASIGIAAQVPRKSNSRPAPQKPQPAPTPTPSEPPLEPLKVDPNLVTIPVIATDLGGLYVSDLRQDEFSIYEDDVKQNIGFFKTVSAPLYVILVLDTSASSEERLRQIRQAALTFVEQLRPADRVKVISFSDEVSDLNEFTNNREELKTAILKTRSGQGTKLYDAFDLALVSIRRIQGRKAIVLFSDGVDWHSDRATFDVTLRGLDEEGVAVYPVRSDTRIEAERVAREQDPTSQLPTIGVIRNPSAGAPEFPKDDSETTQTQTRTIGLPRPPDIIRQRPDDYPQDGQPRSPADRRPPDVRGPVDDRTIANPRRPPSILLPEPPKGPAAKDPGRPVRSEKLRDDPIKVMLDQIYVNADAYLKELADKSGGRLLRADTIGSLPDAFAKVAAELRTQYSLGYYPTNTDHGGQLRTVRIVISRANVTARARSGYRGRSDQ